MNLSIFDNDQTLGDARTYDPSGTLLRDVELQIDGQFPTPGLADTNANGIRNTLNGKGWMVEQVTDLAANWFPGFSGYSYRVFAVVGTNFTDRQIQDQIRRDLVGFFNVSNVSTLSAPWTPPSGYVHNAGQIATVNVPIPPANYQPILPATRNQPSAASGGGFLDQLGFGLGISTPLVLVGVGIVALVILRK